MRKARAKPGNSARRISWTMFSAQSARATLEHVFSRHVRGRLADRACNIRERDGLEALALYEAKRFRHEAGLGVRERCYARGAGYLGEHQPEKALLNELPVRPLGVGFGVALHNQTMDMFVPLRRQTNDGRSAGACPLERVE
jgi:hypothetical protein